MKAVSVIRTIAGWLPQIWAIKAGRIIASARFCLHYRDRNFFQQVFLETETSCNRSCWYCPEQKKLWSRQAMPEAVFDRCVERLREIDYCGMVGFTLFNEPLRNPKLLEQIRAVVRSLPRACTTLFTNGDYLTADCARDLIQSGLGRCTVTEHPPFSSKWRERVVPIVEAHPDVFRLYRVTEPINVAGLIPEIEGDYARPCQAPKFAFPIRFNGDVAPCCCDYERRVVMGNVMQQSLKEIWYSDEFVKSRKQLGKRPRIAPWGICVKCTGVQ